MSGLSPEISYLEVLPTLLSPRARQAAGARVSDNLSAFLLELPPEASGIAQLAVRGRQGQGNDCLVAEGAGIVQFTEARRSQVEIALKPVPERTACWLEVAARGVGEAEIVSVPPGISCGGASQLCGAHFPLGQQVELHLKNVTSYFDSWEGAEACSGRDGCTVAIGDKPQTVNVNLVEPRVCSRGRWCWESPLPFGGVIAAVWAASATELWAVGQDGVVWRRSSSAGLPPLKLNNGWEPVASGTRVNLNGLWGTSPTDIWAVGDRGTILRWDGVAFSPLPGPAAETTALTGIWGSDKNDVWILGESASTAETSAEQVLLHWQDGRWTSFPAPDGLDTLAYRIWGSGPQDVWALGGFYSTADSPATRVLLHWHGNAWSAVSPPALAKESFDGVCGSGAADVWIVGGNLEPAAQAIWHWDGARWASFSSGTSVALLNCWAAGPGEAWAVGVNGVILHFHAGRWDAAVPPDEDASSLNAIRGSGPGDIWAVGDGGSTLHFDGRSWTSFGAGPRYWINGIWGSRPTDVWAVGGNSRSNIAALLHWDGTAFSFMAAQDYPELNGIWGSSDKDIWAVDTSGSLLHWNGQRWSAFRSATQQSLRGIWGSPVAAGSGIASLWPTPGTQRRKDPSGTDPDDPKDPKTPKDPMGPSHPGDPIDPAAAKDIWAVGDKGTIVHWNGRSWTTSPSGTGMRLSGIWGSGSKDIWAVGDGGTVLHWDGGAWTGVTSGTEAILRAVWGSDKDDVWAVGGKGAPIVLHFDGRAWSLVDKKKLPPLTNPSLSGIWGSGRSDVRIVDLYSGSILHYDGVQWSAAPSGASQLQSIWGSGPNDIWVGGLSSILRYRP